MASTATNDLLATATATAKEVREKNDTLQADGQKLDDQSAALIASEEAQRTQFQQLEEDLAIARRKAEVDHREAQANLHTQRAQHEADRAKLHYILTGERTEMLEQSPQPKSSDPQLQQSLDQIREHDVPPMYWETLTGLSEAQVRELLELPADANMADHGTLIGGLVHVANRHDEELAQHDEAIGQLQTAVAGLQEKSASKQTPWEDDNQTQRHEPTRPTPPIRTFEPDDTVRDDESDTNDHSGGLRWRDTPSTAPAKDKGLIGKIKAARNGMSPRGKHI